MSANKSIEDVIISLVEFAKKRKVTISRREMLKIAQLVKIKLLSDDEIEFFSKELAILNWIHDILSQVNTEGVFPVYYGNIDKSTYTRDDVVNSQNIKREILFNAKSEHGYFVVPRAIRR
ncbi:MAG: aspartyl/glutamyl-tRNA amidotransferase subunit C [Wolbachia endosymbiont of Menacanthus eurysternus]|nr:MAG: aspartyl/glutamyl-tRNA amidotransferase subunit C [Wolbachia endosymbiont of Menacanthus eurysternus]